MSRQVFTGVSFADGFLRASMLDLVDVASCFSLGLVNLLFLKVKLESAASLFCPN